MAVAPGPARVVVRGMGQETLTHLGPPGCTYGAGTPRRTWPWAVLFAVVTVAGGVALGLLGAALR